MKTLKFEGVPKKFNLIPIGDIAFVFDNRSRRKGKQIHVNSVNIMCETDVKLSDETYKMLMREMKKAKTDLLTDGCYFFTTRGEVLTQIDHPQFERELEMFKELHPDEYQEFMYG